MAQIKFTVNGEVQLSRNLRVAAKSIQNMSTFIKEAVWIVEQKSDSIFSQQWRNVEKSPTWKSLAASTLAARARRSWYYKQSPAWNPWILRWTWRLQKDRTKTVTDKMWTLTFNAPYAIHHQEWWRKLPKRAIIDLDNNTNTKIVKALQKKINESIWIFWNQT